jgi:transcriptional regulator with XRE-family HTH domain
MHLHAEERTGHINCRIGVKVRHARMLKGMTLESLGGIIGVSHQQMQKYEAGHNTLSPEKLTALAKALEVPITYFFDEPQAGKEPDGRRQIHLERLMRRLQEIERRSPRVFHSICQVVGALVRAEE